MKQIRARPYPPVFYLFSISFGSLLSLLLLEGILQILPVGNAVLQAEVDERYRIKRYSPNDVVRWSAGWNFKHRTVKRTNSLGYLNDHDCLRARRSSSMAVIGDSYVEALQVANQDAHHGLLNTGLRTRGQVCGIGTSGSSLSSYLVYADLAKNELLPEAITFIIVGNDFDESMCRYFNMGIGMWCFMEMGKAQFELVPISPPVSLPRELGRHSALLRYIAFNLQIDWRDILGGLPPREAKAPYVGNVSAQVSTERLQYSRTSVDLFLKQLPEKSGLPRDRLLFVVDGVRQDIYSGNPSGDSSFFGQMRDYFIDSAKKHGHEVIDLHPVFAHDYSIHKEKFEYLIDGHWNELGHYLVAHAIAESNTIANTLGKVLKVGKRPAEQVY